MRCMPHCGLYIVGLSARSLSGKIIAVRTREQEVAPMMLFLNLTTRTEACWSQSSQHHPRHEASHTRHQGEHRQIQAAVVLHECQSYQAQHGTQSTAVHQQLRRRLRHRRHAAQRPADHQHQCQLRDLRGSRAKLAHRVKLAHRASLHAQDRRHAPHGHGQAQDTLLHPPQASADQAQAHQPKKHAPRPLPHLARHGQRPLLQVVRAPPHRDLAAL
mmetsp:Transcript_71550/g.141897  ORF Transcript_71550/g.141897 Transcript_71550/m.141897 type:complete len:216 (+) Transcript_71550:817-1464(+)